jgi:hypothetical protein
VLGAPARLAACSGTPFGLAPSKQIAKSGTGSAGPLVSSCVNGHMPAPFLTATKDVYARAVSGSATYGHAKVRCCSRADPALSYVYKVPS